MAPGTPKLLAEWFWTDRWMGSSAFLLPIEPRGLYREMMSQAWRRGAKLPNDPDQIRRAIAATTEEWDRCWPIIRQYWRVDEHGYLVNDTQLEVYAEALGVQQRARQRGKNGAAARAQAVLKHKPPSPSPTDTLEKQECQVRAGFDSFWSVYPKKKSRAAAEKAWFTLAPDPGLIQQILDAVAAQAETPDWTKDSGRYVPYPATWLNGKRWLDEVGIRLPRRSNWREECRQLQHDPPCVSETWHDVVVARARGEAV